MANDAKIGIGAIIKRNGVEIVGVEGTSGIEREKPPIESTNFGSGGFQEIGGLLRAAPVTLAIQHNPAEATHTGLYDDFTNNTDQAFSVTYPFSTPRVWSFTGRVVKCSEPLEIEGKMMFNVEIRPQAGSFVLS